MGIDWAPMRVRADVADSELARRITAQRETFRATGWHPDADSVGGEAADSAFLRADQELRDVVAVVQDGDWWPSFRVGVIGANPLLPPAWREAAWSSLSPAQARADFARWQQYYADRADLRDRWLEEFFGWAAPYLDDGCGLYLWA